MVRPAFIGVQMTDTRPFYVQASMSAALTAPRTAATSTRDATERYLELVREHQQRYLEAAGSAAAEVRGIGQLESVAASTLQLSRQFFDAQRAIVGRVGRHHADLLDQHAGDDLLDLAAWDAGAATRQLAALLDGWWAALNSNVGTTIDDAAARSALVRQIDRIEHTHASSSAGAVDTSTSCLPEAVRYVLERADHSDFRSLLQQLDSVLQNRPSADVLAESATTDARALPAAEPAAFPPPCGPAMLAAPVVAGVTPAVAMPIAELQISDGRSVHTRIHEELLTRLERLEQDRRPFWNETDRADAGDDAGWFPTPAVVSIAAATAALTTALALIG